MYGNCYVIDILTIAVKYTGQDILAGIGQSALCRLAFLNSIVGNCYILGFCNVTVMFVLHCEESKFCQRWQFHIYIFTI